MSLALKALTINDSYYVPIRRRISLDWLQWHKNNRLRNPLLNTQQNEMLLQQYCIFLCYLATNFQHYKTFQARKTCTFKDTSIGHHNIHSNSRIWAELQLNRQDLNDKVPPYDGLLLKYNSYLQPVLHPLLTHHQVYRSNDECIPHQMGERIFKFDQSDQNFCTSKNDQQLSNHNLIKIRQIDCTVLE